MKVNNAKNQKFHEYFAEWIKTYKCDAVRDVTYRKCLNTSRYIAELAPSLKICELDKRSYQALLNDYAKTHERQTTIDFHRHLKSAILDIVDEGLLVTDPTRKVVLKGRAPVEKKIKFLSQFELQALLQGLTLTKTPNWDWFILILAKTGLRFSEALGLTPNDFDFVTHKITISKTWNYKDVNGGFAETKNTSSKRTIRVDAQLNTQLSVLIKGLPENKPIFVQGRVFSSTVNSRLNTLCKKANVPVISIHSLRHTHASLLIYAGVSIVSVSRRLGHANTTTTQDTYLHIIKELDEQDNDKIMQHLTGLI